MKPRLSPLHITLKDLPPEGRKFSYDRESGELNEALADLIDDNSYKVEFTITPMGNAFDLKGQITTNLDLQCSLCAIDLKHRVSEAIHELLVIQKPLNKGDQQTKTNHAHEWSEQGPNYILLETDVFHVAEYVHEVIGLAEPIRPLGKPDCDLSCENMSESTRKWLIAGESSEIRTNPFHVLEKIKLKS
jgi:uncharacterized metal-binding protein YceD (DUF177 family)